MIKIEIALNNERLCETGFEVENTWRYIDNVFCGNERHMKKEVHGDTRTYIADFKDNENDEWLEAVSGMLGLAKQDWFRKSVSKMLYHRADGCVEDAKVHICDVW